MNQAVLFTWLLMQGWPPPPTPNTFAGTWETTFGKMTLTQRGQRVEGTYVMGEQLCSVQGDMSGRKLTFRYVEPQARGEGWFELAADGKSFRGEWREDGTASWADWVGKRLAMAAGPPRSFDGLWETTFGRMRLAHEGDRVRGSYAYAAGSTLNGKLEGRRLMFQYKEPAASGEGWFELAADGRSFQGKWKVAGTAAWSDWKGTRVDPHPGRVWLVVLEANWEAGLADNEYAFGNMLRAFFSRAPHVQVRQRFFQDEAGLRRWCSEVAYLAEPTVLAVASHGSSGGVTVGSQTIGAAAFADTLRYATNVRLLHFSACETMRARLPEEIARRLGGPAKFPISGYKTSVDWASSAIIEFMYFDLILIRGMQPARAAHQLRKLMPFADDKPVAGSVLPPAGFRLLLPDEVNVAEPAAAAAGR